MQPTEEKGGNFSTRIVGGGQKDKSSFTASVVPNSTSGGMEEDPGSS